MKKIFQAIIATIFVFTSFACIGQSNKKPPRSQVPADNKEYNTNAYVHSKKEMKKQVGEFAQAKHGGIVRAGKRQKRAIAKKGR